MIDRLTAYVIALCAAAALFLAPHVASAHGSHDGKRAKVYDHGHVHHGGHGHLRPDHHACRTIYRFGRHGVRKTVICDGPVHRRTAKAHHHAQRHKAPYTTHHASRRYTVSPPPQNAYRSSTVPVSPVQACNSRLAAGAIGGITGAILGSRIGEGSGRIAATAAGTTIGAIAGLNIGDTLDRRCLAPASVTGR